MKKCVFFAIFVVALSMILMACNVLKGADGKDGLDGHSPEIAIVDGYWTIDGVRTNVKALGTDGTDGSDGHSPIVSIDKTGHWTLDGVSTGVKAVGADGQNGVNGQSAYQIAVNNGFDGTEQEWLQSLQGKNGINGINGETPTISIDGNGYWVINGTPTQTLAEGVSGADGHSPEVAIVDGYWAIDGVSTGVKAVGIDGTDGHSPVISIDKNGYWTIDGVPTDVKALGTDGTDGTDGHSPEVAIVDGYWAIDGVSTGVKAVGADGQNGVNGQSAYQIAVNKGFEGTEQEWLQSLHGQDGINGETPTISIDGNGYWVINGTPTQTLAEGISGADGHSPEVAIVDGYWAIDGVSTGVKAVGIDGQDGHSPVISIDKNGYWAIDGVPTDVKALGADGTDGHSPEVAIVDGYWAIDGVSTGVKAAGIDGQNGVNIYDLYVQYYDYSGTEEEWLADVLSGNLGVVETHTVSLDYNGYDQGSPVALSVVDGRCVTLPTPAREGYDFLGWYTGLGVNDGQWTNSLIVDSDLDLVARWRQQNVVVRYVDIEGNLLSEQTVPYGEDSIAPAAPAMASYVFDHWDGATTAHVADVTLRPVYIVYRYTVTYDSMGGSDVLAASYLYTETPVKPTDPTKSGWVFDGWQIDGTDTVYAFDAPFDGDITLKALWTDTVRVYTVQDLLAIADNPTINYTLAKDINLDGAEWTPLETFSGVLDGDGHKIFDFQMTQTNANLAFIQTNVGTIRNITFADVMVSQTSVGSHTAVIACYNEGTIESVRLRDIYVTYSTTSLPQVDKVAGLVANNRVGGSVCNCSAEGQMRVTSTISSKNTEVYWYAGGIVAVNSGQVDSCRTALQITIKSTASNTSSNVAAWSLATQHAIGSICGYNYDSGSIVNCCADVNISATLASYKKFSGYVYQHSFIGGAIGITLGAVNAIRTSGTMSLSETGDSSGYGVKEWGGAIGRLEKGTADTVYSAVALTGSVGNASTSGGAGGVIAVTYANTTATNIWYDGTLSTDRINCVGGLCGNNNGTVKNAYVTGSISVMNGVSWGIIIGNNSGSGFVGKYIIDSDGYTGNGVGGGDGIIGKYYTMTDDNKADIYDEEFLFGEGILSADVWGVVAGESVYLKAFAE
jgi:uncharacterized repeat protein (TIGR02543 family)